MAVSEEELKELGKVEVLPRHKAEYEFDKRFDRTRPNQLIARVTMVKYFKHYSAHTSGTRGQWVEIKEKDMTDI